jgi:hypothetical protein
LVEQLPGTSTWSRSFLTVPLKTRIGGDTFRVIAAQDNTTVSINGAEVAHLDKGGVHQQIISGSSAVTSDKPVLVAQYSNGSTFDGVTSDPFMMLVSPAERYLDNYTFATPATGFSRNFVNVIIPTTAIADLVLDGDLVPASEFTVIGASSYSSAQLEVAAGSHIMKSSKAFGIGVYGFDEYDSYGYPGGTAF